MQTAHDKADEVGRAAKEQVAKDRAAQEDFKRATQEKKDEVIHFAEQVRNGAAAKGEEAKLAVGSAAEGAKKSAQEGVEGARSGAAAVQDKFSQGYQQGKQT